MNKCLNCGKLAKNKYCSIKCCNQHQSPSKIKNLSTKEVREKATQTRKNKWKTFVVKCFICNKEIEIKEFNVNKPKKEKYYCSRSCANTRQFSEESNKKRSESLKRETIHKWKEPHICICENCKKEYVTIYKNIKFCSRVCKHETKPKLDDVRHSKKFKEKIKILVLKQYFNGKKVYGGTTKWFNYKDIKVQGTYELRTCFILDRWKEEGKIKNWEYTNDRIEYIGTDNKKHTYLLDFKVFENTNSFYYIETKGYVHENDELKWKATRDKGYKLEVWFNEEIKKYEK